MSRVAAVVGAGVLGRLLALRLRRAGYYVTLFDRGDWLQRTACSFAAAGLLAPVAETVHGAPPILLSLGRRSRGLWQHLLPTLAAPVILGVTGTLHVAHGADQPLLDELQQQLQRKVAAADASWVRAPEMQELAPSLAQAGFTRALHLPADGYIQSHAALTALQLSLAAEGVECRLQTEVVAVGPGRVETRLAGVFACDVVFDCRGLGARGDLPELRGVRGELIEVQAPEVSLALPVQVMHPRYPIYIVPRGGGTYAIGATSIESESMAPVTVKAALELLSASYSVHPGFRFGHITSLVAHCRPALPDNLPEIQVTPGLWRLNGLYRHGFLLAPVMVDCVVRTLAGAGLAEDELSLLKKG